MQQQKQKQNQNDTPTLLSNSYGKGKVRLTKVKRGAHLHEIMQFDISVALEGEFVNSYSEGDNRNVVATDTIKNTCYAIASDHPCNDPETFAVDLCRHFLRQYNHVSSAQVELTQDLYDRMPVPSQGDRLSLKNELVKPQTMNVGHPYAFIHRGTEKRWVKAKVRRDAPRNPDVWTGIIGLTVLKTAGSEWADFHRDEYRTLGDSKDRILATSVQAKWQWNSVWNASFNDTYNSIRKSLLDIFANHHSHGVQQTMFKVGEQVVKNHDFVERIKITLPNIHHVPFDLSKLGGRVNRNEIFIATSEPFGLIHCEVARERSKL
jgi:urate oxidase